MLPVKKQKRCYGEPTDVGTCQLVKYTAGPAFSRTQTSKGSFRVKQLMSGHSKQIMKYILGLITAPMPCRSSVLGIWATLSHLSCHGQCCTTSRSLKVHAKAVNFLDTGLKQKACLRVLEQTARTCQAITFFKAMELFNMLCIQWGWGGGTLPPGACQALEHKYVHTTDHSSGGSGSTGGSCAPPWTSRGSERQSPFPPLKM